MTPEEYLAGLLCPFQKRKELPEKWNTIVTAASIENRPQSLSAIARTPLRGSNPDFDTFLAAALQGVPLEGSGCVEFPTVPGPGNSRWERLAECRNDGKLEYFTYPTYPAAGGSSFRRGRRKKALFGAGED